MKVSYIYIVIFHLNTLSPSNLTVFARAIKFKYKRTQNKIEDSLCETELRVPIPSLNRIHFKLETLLKQNYQFETTSHALKITLNLLNQKNNLDNYFYNIRFKF